jgi:hypothetical protein
MPSREYTRKQIETPCEKCGARPGEFCTKPKPTGIGLSILGKPHPERVRLAEGKRPDKPKRRIGGITECRKCRE